MTTENTSQTAPSGDETEWVSPPARPRRDASGDPATLVREIRATTFPVALRGYDRRVVDGYVARVERLVGEVEARHSPDAAVRRALDRVGEETSSILQRAQETGDELTARSRAQADDRLRRAEQEATAMREEAEQAARTLREDSEAQLRELDADLEAIWEERRRLIEDVRRLSETLALVAEAAGERFPADAAAGDEADGSDEPDVLDPMTATAGDEPAQALGLNGRDVVETNGHDTTVMEPDHGAARRGPAPDEAPGAVAAAGAGAEAEAASQPGLPAVEELPRDEAEGVGPDDQGGEEFSDPQRRFGR
jgi:cell division septum initiation protein DivIVA